jgi:Domain of unknown function (DUF4105)
MSALRVAHAKRGSINRHFTAVVGYGCRAITILFSLWSLAALCFERESIWMRIVLVSIYLGIAVAVLSWVKSGIPRVSVALAGNCLVAIWFSTLAPPHHQEWSPEFARTPWSEQNDDAVTIHDIRNFSYRTEHEFTQRWEDRTIGLHEIIGADLFLTHWGVPLIAHSIVSFRFADGSFLATSIEARLAMDQKFSAFSGFFRQFQVAYLIAEERDIIRLRTNYRQHEDVYLYRTRLSPLDARALLLQYLTWMNSAHRRAEWYNALTRNCSTPFLGYLAAAKVGGVSRWDWRGILDGRGDEMLYELGDLKGDDLSFRELKSQALINPVARAAGDADDFSRAIRLGRAGFAQ